MRACNLKHCPESCQCGGPGTSHTDFILRPMHRPSREPASGRHGRRSPHPREAGLLSVRSRPSGRREPPRVFASLPVRADNRQHLMLESESLQTHQTPQDAPGSTIGIVRDFPQGGRPPHPRAVTWRGWPREYRPPRSSDGSGGAGLQARLLLVGAQGPRRPGEWCWGCPVESAVDRSIRATDDVFLGTQSPQYRSVPPVAPRAGPWGGKTASFPTLMAGLPRSSGTCPFPGVPSSVNSPSPGSPVRSVGWRVMVQPVGSPTRLWPSEVTGPAQSRPFPVLSATSVFCSANTPSSLRSLPTLNRDAFPATVQFVRMTVPLWFVSAAPLLHY